MINNVIDNNKIIFTNNNLNKLYFSIYLVNILCIFLKYALHINKKFILY